MGKFTFTNFIMHIILLVVFLGLINMIFDLHRFAFMGELLILSGIFLVAIIAVVGTNNNFKWAWILLTLFFIFIFLDMLFIFVISKEAPDFFLPLLVVVIVGFFISLFSIQAPKISVPEEVKTTHSPGKYIASRTGSKFHAPKCDWAKKVKKANAVWFDTKEEAKKAGYKADACVK